MIFDLFSMLLLLVINSLVIWGFFYATEYEKKEITQDGVTGMGYVVPNKVWVTEQNILGFIKKWGDEKLPEWLMRPLYGCPPCMSSIHSIYVYWFYMPFTWDSLLAYPIYILALCGLNYIVSNKIHA